MPETSIGLCSSCVHQRMIRSGRGSTFSMCERGLKDAAWPKYPRLPVLRCAGYEAQSATPAGNTR